MDIGETETTRRVVTVPAPVKVPRKEPTPLKVPTGPSSPTRAPVKVPTGIAYLSEPSYLGGVGEDLICPKCRRELTLSLSNFTPVYRCTKHGVVDLDTCIGVA